MLKVAKEPLQVVTPNIEKTLFSGNFELREDAPENRAQLSICDVSDHIYLFCDFEERPGADQAEIGTAQRNASYVATKGEKRPHEDSRMTSTSVAPPGASNIAADGIITEIYALKCFGN